MSGWFHNRLERLVTQIKEWLKTDRSDEAGLALELLDSAENLPELEYVLSESGIGVVPQELLDSSGFGEIPDFSEPVRRPPVTGVIARGRWRKRRAG